MIENDPFSRTVASSSDGQNQIDTGRRTISIGQELFWKKICYNYQYMTKSIGFILSINKDIDINCLVLSINRVLETYAILRGCFKEDLERLRFEQECSVISTEYMLMESDNLALETVNKLSSTHFSLNSDSFARSVIVENISGVRIWIWIAHPMVWDCLSNTILLTDTQEIYLQKNFSPEKNEPAGSNATNPGSSDFADFVEWERNYVISQRSIDARAYWRRHISAPNARCQIDELMLSRYSKNEAGLNFIDIKDATWDKIVSVSNKERCTPFITLLGLFGACLAKHFNVKAVKINVETDLRPNASYKRCVGYLTSDVLLILDSVKWETPIEAIRLTRQTFLEALEHRHSFALDLIQSGRGCVGNFLSHRPKITFASVQKLPVTVLGLSHSDGLMSEIALDDSLRVSLHTSLSGRWLSLRSSWRSEFHSDFHLLRDNYACAIHSIL